MIDSIKQLENYLEQYESEYKDALKKRDDERMSELELAIKETEMELNELKFIK